MAIVSIKDKGTQIMDGMLLSQYKESPLLRAYLLAYIEEMDLLFQSIEEVHFGRMLEHAVGAQLDIIGVILQQTRDVVLPIINFGFVGAQNVGKMADEAAPAEGGVFLDEYISGLSVTPLNDSEYRKMLQCKGSLLSSPTLDIESTYRAIWILLGKVPETLTFAVPSDRHLDLTVSSVDVTAREQTIILYMAKYIIPNAVTFNITTV